MSQLKIRRSVQPQRLGRRSFLRGTLSGAVGVSLGLPMLDIMLNESGTALADRGALPRRFGVFYWGGGIQHASWVPGTTGTGWELPYSLEPFAPVRDYVSLITGTNHGGSSPGHIPSRGIALSASHDMSTNVQGVGRYRSHNHPEPSVDALVAEHWRGAAPYDLLAVGICRKGPYRSNSSWNRGGSAYNRHEPSPQALFDRIFSGSSAPAEDTSLLEVANTFERSMLDAVSEDVRALQGRLGAADRIRLEQHLEGLRALERRIMDVENGRSCDSLGRPVRTDFGDGSEREQKEPKSELMSQILAHAMACDLTRVFSFEFSGTQSQAFYPEVGIDEEHHEYNHQNQRSQGMADITRFIMKNFAYLATQLQSMPEAGGNLLDRTLILGTSELAVAGAHNYTDHPYIYVGGCGMRGAVHHRLDRSNRDSPRCLLTAVRAVGVDVPSIGQENSSGGSRVAAEPFTEIMA
ncbi:MAG: DUF1552 domain-containing protein [Myxococcota bacterium]